MLRFVTRSVAQAHVLTNTARGNMNNISSCLVKSTHVAFLVLIVNDHSLYRTRLLRVTNIASLVDDNIKCDHLKIDIEQSYEKNNQTIKYLRFITLSYKRKVE